MTRKDIQIEITIPVSRFLDGDRTATIRALNDAGFPEAEIEALVRDAQKRHEPVIGFRVTGEQFSRFLIYRNRYGAKNLFSELNAAIIGEHVEWHSLNGGRCVKACNKAVTPLEQKLRAIETRCYREAAQCGPNASDLRTALRETADALHNIRADLPETVADKRAVEALYGVVQSTLEYSHDNLKRQNGALRLVRHWCEKHLGLSAHECRTDDPINVYLHVPEADFSNAANYAASDVPTHGSGGGGFGGVSERKIASDALALELDKIETRLRDILAQSPGARWPAIKKLMDDIHTQRGLIQLSGTTISSEDATKIETASQGIMRGDVAPALKLIREWMTGGKS